jgi:sulfur relay (sulfurtransferase) DsrF/TusC family protein
MAQKTVMLTINHAPHGSGFCAEGLRTAMGVISTMDEHSAIVVFLGEGAWAAPVGVDRGEASRYLATLVEWGCLRAVEMESLEKAGIRTDEVAPDIAIIRRAAIRALLETADFVIDF